MEQYISIIIDISYGDSGKGVCTHNLCIPEEKTLNIRYAGAAQCGHTVRTKDGKEHVFSQFGSGTFNGADTYYGEGCMFYPVEYLNEKRALEGLGMSTNYYIHPLTPVCTPWDVAYNRAMEVKNGHGSVGMGFGAAVQRHTETPYKLYVKDLFYDDILSHRFREIEDYYHNNLKGLNVPVPYDTFWEFMNAIKFIRTEGLNMQLLGDIKGDYEHIIFEGHQGIMLDMDHGFFPHVTRSNTTSKGAMSIIREEGLNKPEVYYVMRAYLTRHGNGPMPGERDITLVNNERETNVLCPWQGVFRKGYHTSDMLKYALETDYCYSGNDMSGKNLVITCLDQTDNYIFIDNGCMSLDDFVLSGSLGFREENIFTSRSGISIKKEFVPLLKD